MINDIDEQRGGVCPICNETDGYVNIGRDHIGHCEEHRIAWQIGANLFSSWRHETAKEQIEIIDELDLPSFRLRKNTSVTIADIYGDEIAEMRKPVGFVDRVADLISEELCNEMQGHVPTANEVLDLIDEIRTRVEDEWCVWPAPWRRMIRPTQEHGRLSPVADRLAILWGRTLARFKKVDEVPF
jgi:hypothetical protein